MYFFVVFCVLYIFKLLIYFLNLFALFLTLKVDFKRAKEVNSNYSREVYIEECQKQIQQSMLLQKHFRKKGTIVRGLELIKCGPDDRFQKRQCLEGKNKIFQCETLVGTIIILKF